MAKEVILTPLAVINYEVIVAYLVTNWGLTAANNFIERFEKICVFLAEAPGNISICKQSETSTKMCVN
jgi:plasmid stabilization system protein ParE